MYTYRLTPLAVTDLQEISDYIANQLYAPESAVDLLNEIEESIKKACLFPLSVPPVSDPLLKIKGYRKIIVKNYIVFILPDQNNQVMNVMRIMYYARDYINEL